MSEIFYYSGLENGTGIRSRNLEDAILIPNFFLLLMSETDTIHKTNYNNVYEYFRYKIIDKQGNRSTFSIGSVTCLDFGTETRKWGEDAIVKPVIVDFKGDTLKLKFDTSANKWGENFADLINSMKEIDSFGSIKTFFTHQENIELKNKILILEQKIIDLEALKEENKT
jgi:hypothetical protein